MKDIDRVFDLFSDLGILSDYTCVDRDVFSNIRKIRVEESDTDKVVGYMCFYSLWEFDEYGNFIKVGFYE